MSEGELRVAAIGEVMVEICPAGVAGGADDLYRTGFAGDTFNTAVGFARLGVPIDYITRLGDDTFSDRILSLMSEEGVGTDLIERAPGRLPGLYLIANEPDGERSFQYWRETAPVRELWSDAESALVLEQKLSRYSCIYLSGVTLGVLRPAGRANLKRFLAGYRQHGGRVAFDSNYRPRLWRDTAEARSVIEEFFRITDIALVTLEDERALWGKESPAEIVDHLCHLGVSEVVIKQGRAPVVLHSEGETREAPVPPVTGIVDTTGAGDAFNAGYLSQRLRGFSALEAAAMGSRAASAVIRHRGGVVPRAWFVGEVVQPSTLTGPG